MTSPRLLALTTSQEDGGAESHLRTTLTAARARGYEVHVALPRAAETAQLWSDLRGSGYSVYSLKLGRRTTSKVGAYAAIASDFLSTLWAIARVRPQVLLLNLPTPEATPGAMLACALTRVGTTAIFHLVRSELQVTAARRSLYRAIARSRQRWVCVSDDNRVVLAKQFGVSPRRIAVVHNGIDYTRAPPGHRDSTRAALGLSPGSTVILTTGRLGAQKDHRVIVAALSRLIAIDPSLVFVWAGDGPLREELTLAVEATGLTEHVRLLGRRGDVPELLGAADLFLLPSRDEGGAPPFALAEAMYAGVPAVVSDAGSLTEIIEDRENGIVFARGDADDLVRAIEWALSNRDQVAQIAARATQHAKREFGRERMIEGLMSQITPRRAKAGGG